jgi:hypothetical protein
MTPASFQFRTRGLLRRHAQPSSTRECWRHLRACAACAVVVLAVQTPLAAQGAADPAQDLLGLEAAQPDATLPPGWITRAVRGQRSPMSRIVDSSGVRYMRVSGRGEAAWFVRQLPAPLRASAGRMHWTWRAPVSPSGADVGMPGTDDAALRVFVVFGRHGNFLRKPRVLFYSLADGTPTAHRTSSPFGVRVAARPADTRDWMMAATNPFDDYRQLWGDAPPPIIAVGVMQDTDQTRSAAIGDVMHLHWRDANAAPR